jgi:hypothetical protein
MPAEQAHEGKLVVPTSAEGDGLDNAIHIVLDESLLRIEMKILRIGTNSETMCPWMSFKRCWSSKVNWKKCRKRLAVRNLRKKSYGETMSIYKYRSRLC